MARTNWKKLGIEELQYRYGFERNIAEHYWENAYRQALRRARKAGVTKNFNVSREVYASAFYQGSQLFNISFANIFFKPVSCLYIPLRASFTEQTFLILCPTYYFFHS